SASSRPPWETARPQPWPPAGIWTGSDFREGGDRMKVALIQMQNVQDKQTNLDKAEALIREAASGGADLCVLPEMFCCEYRNRAFVENQEPVGGPAWTMLSRAAAENGVWLIGGSIPETAEDGEIY